MNSRRTGNDDLTDTDVMVGIEWCGAGRGVDRDGGATENERRKSGYKISLFAVIPESARCPLRRRPLALTCAPRMTEAPQLLRREAAALGPSSTSSSTRSASVVVHHHPLLTV
jgi:hypothetical protein